VSDYTEGKPEEQPVEGEADEQEQPQEEVQGTPEEPAADEKAAEEPVGPEPTLEPEPIEAAVSEEPVPEQEPEQEAIVAEPEPEPEPEAPKPPPTPKPAPAPKPEPEPAEESVGTVELIGNAIIAQSGGPTNVINQSLVGAIKEMARSREIKGIYGALHGLKGMLAEDFVDLRAENPRSLDKLAKTPSAALGSVRMKPTREDCHKLFDICKKRDVRYFFYIGGNDSAETAHIIATEAADANYDMRVYHIPKTIDNDLRETDHCPGYGSAARFVALALMGDQLDNRSIPGVKIDVVMGRHAGFLTAASALGQQRSDDGPHLVYLPERTFYLARFAEDVKRVHDELGRCVVAVSEGIQDDQGDPIYKSGETDSHGNVQLSGTGALGDYLARYIKEELGPKLRVRADTFGYLQRCFPEVVSKVDAEEAALVGRKAVQCAVMDEHPSGSIVIKRTGTTKTYAASYEWTALENVARDTRSMPDDFINAESNGVTEAFREYALPLVGKLPRYGWLKGKKV